MSLQTNLLSTGVASSRAIGWVNGRLYSLVYEIREDVGGEYYRLVTLWKSTREERRLYEQHH